MTPFHPDVRKKMLEAAARAFPKKTAQTLEREFDEMLRLKAKQFETGEKLTPIDKRRLDRLHKQFSPKKP